mgnify:CR=1 FL=1
MAVVEQILVAERARHRQVRALGELAQRGARVISPSGCRRPARAAARASRSNASAALTSAAAGVAAIALDERRIGDVDARRQHVFGQREHDRSRPPDIASR